MESQKGGEKAYTLLRDALESSAKIGIAKVVLKIRQQHLAVLKSQQNCLEYKSSNRRAMLLRGKFTFRLFY